MNKNVSRVLVAAGVAWATGVAAQALSVDRPAVDAGGGTSEGNGFVLSGAIGRSNGARMEGERFEIVGGIALGSPLIAGDCNGSGTVEQGDYAGFEACLQGPDVARSPSCSCGDIDGDGDVDVADFARFQRRIAE